MRYFCSVGEPSGDLHGSRLIEAVRQADPHATFIGFGGPQMEAAGCDLIYPLAEHAIMGLWGALADLPKMVRLLRDCQRRFENAATRPDALILIDYPGFNLRLARLAHQAKIPVYYHIPPQFWAWGSWRVQRIRRWVDHLYCSLPFEPAWFAQHGITNTDFMGHPYFDSLIEVPCQRQQDEQLRTAPVVALLPGSRDAEVRMNAPTLLHTAHRLRESIPACQFQIAAFKPDQRRQLSRLFADLPQPWQCDCQAMNTILPQADLAIAVSGSVSLELLHFQVPSLIIYRTSWIAGNILAPLLLNVKHISLVNLIAGERLFPEFLGSRDPAKAVAAQALAWLQDPVELQRIRQRLGELKQQVGQTGATQRVAADLVARLRQRLDGSPAAKPAANPTSRQAA